MEIIEILFAASFWAAAVRIASPLIFATLGELICERAGVLNLGIEGIMVAGAFAGWMAVYSGTGLLDGCLCSDDCGYAFRDGAQHSNCSVWIIAACGRLGRNLVGNLVDLLCL